MNIVMLDRQFVLPKDHGLFENCHASTLVWLPNGDLLLAFLAGRREGEGDTAIWLSYCRSGRWQSPRRLFAEDGLAHWNPVLHADGQRLWIFYKVGPTVHAWTTRSASSDDGGETWTAPRPLVPGDKTPRGPVKNKMIVLSNGDWLAPGSVETETDWDAFVDCSADEGAHWRRFDVAIQHRPERVRASKEIWQGLKANALWESNLERAFEWDGVIQPTLWESPPGQVHMLLRSTRGRIYRSDSPDLGHHWTAAYPTDLPNNNSGIDVVQMTGHRLVLALNPIAGNWGRRSPLSLMSSTDNGTTWSQPSHMETEEGEFSYPAIIAHGEQICVAYTFNRKNIVCRKMAIN
jgi:predicted neuraminidase